MLAGLATTFVAGLAVGCTVDSIGESTSASGCINDASCPAGLVCVNGACVLDTSSDDDDDGDTIGDEVGTDAGESSSDGSDDTTTTTTEGGCEPGTFGCPCLPGNECGPGLECVDGVCGLEGSGESTSTDGGTTGGGTTTGGTTTGGGSDFGMCGWNAMAGYYDCMQSGADPSMQNPIECPNVALMEGAACPQGLTFEGCCEPGGALWYCENGVATTLDCG